MDDKRVTLSLDPGPSPDSPRVRLRTTRAVEEPVVTVNLTAGCVTKSTRQYVLLADLPESAPVVASPPRLAPPAAASAGASADAAPSGASSLSRSSRPARSGNSAAAPRSAATGADSEAAPRPRRRVATVVTPPASGAETVRKPRPAPAKPAAAAAPPPPAEPKSRLKIDALAPEPQAQPQRPALAAGNAAGGAVAGSAPSSASQPSSAAAPAAVAVAAAPGAPGATGTQGVEAPNTAAAAALAAATEQSRRDAERLKELETALATLREQSMQNQRQLLELRGSLAQAEADRYRNPVIYGLLALLALALVGLVILSRQLRNARQAAWWGAAPPPEGEAPAPARKPALPRRGELADDDEGDEDDEEDGDEATADVSGLRSAAQGLRVTALPDGVGASAFQRAPVRGVNADDLFDVQQQAEFFMSLGQHEQAVGVLRDHIGANPDTSAMAYLDLLDVLKLLGRRTDYAAVAQEFGHGFHLAVPDFDHFTGGERGIEHYPDALEHIVSKWPSQGTADLIEAFVFRKPASAEDNFDLPAYQDLLMLYAVARDLGDYNGPWLEPRQVEALAPSAVPADQVEHAYQPTAPMPFLPGRDGGTDALPAEGTMPASLELDLSDLDRTAFETLRAPIEPSPSASQRPGGPSVDPHVIDFDPFDPETNQGELKPRHLGVKR